MASPQMNSVLWQTDFPGLSLLSRGKVRDLYEVNGDLLLVATDRLSAFDVILPTPIPDKGRVLTQLSSFWFRKLEKIARQHLTLLAKVLGEQQIIWKIEILYGNRAQEIASYAAKTKADLIVLTAPRLDPDNPAAGWASLSYKVSLLSQCPVLLVK